MKMTMFTRRKDRPARRLVSGLAIAALLGAPLALFTPNAHADEYEWDPTYGYHEEEWYDPSDWFDVGTGVDYEDDDFYEDYYGDYYGGDSELYDNDYYVEDDYDEDDEYFDGDEYFEENVVDPWYGENYYTSDWYDETPVFDEWYDET